MTLSLGLAILTFGLMVSHYAKGVLFDHSNDLLSGLIMGTGIGVVLIAVVNGVHTRTTWIGD